MLIARKDWLVKYVSDDKFSRHPAHPSIPAAQFTRQCVYANEQQHFPTTNATPFITTTTATNWFGGKRRNPLIRDRTATIRALVSPEFPALLGRFVPV